MYLQDQENLLRANVERVEREVESARGQAKKLEDEYMSTNRSFEEGLKGRSLDPSGLATGECGLNVPPKKGHLVAEMRNRLAQRDELLAQVENLEAQRDKEMIHHARTDRKLLEILIQCERHKKEQFKNLYRDNITVCQTFIRWFYHSMGERIRPIKCSFDQLLQEQNLLAKNKTRSSCWRNGFDQRRISDTETQKTVSDLLSTLDTLEMVLESERLKTETYKQQYQSLRHEYEKVSDRIKQRKSSCTCGPNVPPVLHTTECRVKFTQDDEDLLDALDECVGEIMDNVAEIENQADEEVEVFTREVRQEAATNQWECVMICSLGNRCEQGPDDRLRSKLRSLEAQLQYERDRTEKFDQLRLIVGVKSEDWTMVEKRVAEDENQSKEETEIVGQDRCKRDAVHEDKPAETKSTERSETVKVTEEADTSKDDTDERTSETPQKETEGPSGWFSNKLVKANQERDVNTPNACSPSGTGCGPGSDVSGGQTAEHGEVCPGVRTGSSASPRTRSGLSNGPKKTHGVFPPVPLDAKMLTPKAQLVRLVHRVQSNIRSVSV
ncbi:hypothetical protein Q5P01_004567 [Channa striata]|uniref:Uncharacterized protein n=1 Tax=Channa striata TaxID=64152 RepID=A0AA88NF47_CHASR|nr:hypothetical protein Q5P01_004567 [Channa striata]